MEPETAGAMPAPLRDLTVVEWDTTFETVTLNGKIDPKTFVLY